MKTNEKDYLKKTLWIVILLFILRCMINRPNGLYDCIGFAGEAIGVGLFVMAVYEKYLWKWNPFQKTPKIFGEYIATLEYDFNGKFQKKKIKISIEQTLLYISLKITTDEIVSNTITSDFIYENGEYVLYYTYITNPKSKYNIDNPIQYGTCRMTINSKGLLEGNYWTTRKTKGDIVFKKKLK